MGGQNNENNLVMRHKINLVKQYNVQTVTDIHSLKCVITRGMLPVHLDQCAELGLTAVRVRNDTISHDVKPWEIVRLADDRDLDVHFRIEDFGQEPLAERLANNYINCATRWFEAGAAHLVADAGEFGNTTRKLRMMNAELFANAFGLHTVMFTAKDRQQQEDFLSSFGEEVHLCDVPLSDVNHVEMLRTSGIYKENSVAGTRWQSNAI